MTSIYSNEVQAHKRMTGCTDLQAYYAISNLKVAQEREARERRARR